jgi:hypothetical protein
MIDQPPAAVLLDWWGTLAVSRPPGQSIRLALRRLGRHAGRSAVRQLSTALAGRPDLEHPRRTTRGGG